MRHVVAAPLLLTLAIQPMALMTADFSLGKTDQISELLNSCLKPDSKNGTPCSECPQVVFASEHKTGTHLAEQIMMQMAGNLNCGFHAPMSAAELYLSEHGQLPAQDFLMFSNFGPAEYEMLKKQGKRKFKIIFFVRDPLEMVISGYLYHKKGTEDPDNPDVPYCYGPSHEYIKTLNSLSISEGFSLELSKQVLCVLQQMAYVLRHGGPELASFDLFNFKTHFSDSVRDLCSFAFPGANFEGFINDTVAYRTQSGGCIGLCADAQFAEDVRNIIADVNLNTPAWQELQDIRSLVSQSVMKSKVV